MSRDVLGPARVPVVVLGAGLMGVQIGVEFALHGHRVAFLARHRASSEARLARTLQWAKDLAIADPAIVDEARDAVTVLDRVEALPTDAGLVIETLPEVLETKVTVLGMVAGRMPDAILATNTSSLRIAEIGAGAGAAERMVGIHYWNPPLLMPLVEVTPGPLTEPTVINQAVAMLASIGKIIVNVQRDVPGLIWNRLQFALLREALWLVEQGVASIPEIDLVVQHGLARRWRQIGLFESILLGGPETWERIAGNLFPDLSTATAAGGLGIRVRTAVGDGDALLHRRDDGLASDRCRPHIRRNVPDRAG